MTISNTYLMWIGTEHYGKIEDWIKEAVEQGVSKRLPNAHMGRALAEPGTVVFVAHDEGEMSECEACTGTIECPDCRKAQAAYDREMELAAAHEQSAKEQDDMAERARLLKLASNAQERAKKADEAMDSCDVCLGTNEVVAGSGGKVGFADGETWDYRRYNYHLHQPAKWTPEAKGGVSVMERCECCGGTGRIPNGKVFGMFVPETIEYIDDGKDEAKLEKAKAAGFEVVSVAAVALEPKRGCGKRKGGGTYAVTKVKSDSTAGQEAVEALGLEGVNVHGNFVEFVNHVDISGVKRFRGLARWELPESAQDEAEMILDAAS